MKKYIRPEFFSLDSKAEHLFLSMSMPPLRKKKRAADLIGTRLPRCTCLFLTPSFACCCLATLHICQSALTLSPSVWLVSPLCKLQSSVPRSSHLHTRTHTRTPVTEEGGRTPDHHIILVSLVNPQHLRARRLPAASSRPIIRLPLSVLPVYSFYSFKE